MLSVHILMLLEADLDTWIKHYNEEMTRSEKYRFGKPARQIFQALVKGKMLDSILQTEGACLSD